MNANWGLTKSGKTFHSFNADGAAICRSSTKADQYRESVTGTKVDEMLAEAWGIRVQGYSKCERCATKEAAFLARRDASLAPSTGEGDYLPPVAPVAPVATTDEPVTAPAPCGSVDEELRLLRKVVREAREFASWMTVPDGLHVAVAEYDAHMTGCQAGKDRTWILSPDNIVAVDDVLDAHDIPAKGHWTFNGTETLCTGLKIGLLPFRVARYGDTVTVRHDGTWTITPAEPRVLAV
jgi:hypothetical protein